MNNDFQQQGTQPPQAAPIPQATPMPTAPQAAPMPQATPMPTTPQATPIPQATPMPTAQQAAPIPQATPMPTAPQATPIPQATPMPTAQQTAVPPPPAQFNPNFQNQFGGGGPKPFPKGLLKIIGISVAALVLITVIIIAIYSVRFRPEELTLPQGVKLEMVKIPSGSFQRKGNTVTLTKPFYLGKFEVTQAQWKAVMGSNPSRFKGDNLPVENVTWHDAKEFCKKLNEIYADKLPSGYQFDLPTEAQWEYACRAGTTTDLNNGKNLTSDMGECSNLNEVAWYLKNTGVTTSEVGQKRANSWGLYDMHGNVSEWCRDWYGDYPGRSVTDPVGPSSGSRRVIRGGSWAEFAFCCRSADRGSIFSSYRDNNVGFRLALVPIQ